MRSRRERLLERRLKVVTNEEQKKYAPTLTVEYISKDEDESEGEGWRHMELPWRSDELTQFFRTLDDRLKETKKEYAKDRTRRTKLGVSNKKAPKNAPAWAVKDVEPVQHARGDRPTARGRGALGVRQRGGRGVRTRGGGRGGHENAR
ncbi:Hypothetical predicted protein, partial [Paramuricea clavata]